MSKAIHGCCLVQLFGGLRDHLHELVEAAGDSWLRVVVGIGNGEERISFERHHAPHSN
ncbi:MAG TPA: hypothetical protein VNO31_46120 [Umezawaea sp.]|nr:hypothetical protein [Umezawaea sp.]